MEYVTKKPDAEETPARILEEALTDAGVTAILPCLKRPRRCIQQSPSMIQTSRKVLVWI